MVVLRRKRVSRKKKRTLNVESFVKHRPKRMQQTVNAEEEILPVGEKSPFEINPEVTRRRAKELYLLHGWSKEELLGLGIPEATLNHWLYNPTESNLSWKDEKEIFHRSVLDKMKEYKADELKEVASRGVNVLKRSLLALDLSGEVLTVAQMEKLTTMISKLDPIIKLEEGRPTSIRQDLNLTQKQVAELVEELDGLDPLFDYDIKGKVN